MAAAAKRIPFYTLYGEENAIETIEFVHVEDIASRSKLYNWDIEPHAHHDLFQIMVIVAGQAHMAFDQENTSIRGPCLVLLPAGTVHGFNFDPDTDGKIISVANDFIGTHTRSNDASFIGDSLRNGIIQPYSPNSGDWRRVQQLVTQIDQEFRHPQSGGAIVFDGLLRTLLVYISRHINGHQQKQTSGANHQLLLHRFRELLESHYNTKRTVAHYAQDLCITESKLNRLCHTFTGKSAFESLQDRVLLEAQRYLLYTAAPVAEIAYELGFSDAGYFCRFFKKRTGVTPKTFRRQHSNAGLEQLATNE